MKKILAFTLAVLVVLSMLALAGCNKVKNVNADLENFDSYVSKDSQILGKWQETSTTDEYAWTFYQSTAMHITETVDGVSYSVVCAFNYNDKTGELQYYLISMDETHYYIVTIDGEDMVMTSKDGSDVRTFEKVS